jgi:UDP-GlcNAc:undecaprenyl-phosphate GlcNAc-1-phosphate transferase
MSESSLGIYLIIAFMAMAISMAIVPVMIKYASVMGMIDQPDPRKVHVIPVPRVGGVGIVIGALVPLLIWLPFDNLISSFLIGSFILLVFGIWDDVKELGHYVKFAGQFAASVVVVYYGDLYVAHFPFIGLETLSESVGRPFTVIAIVGMINAINHSDGLDGLAGGESLLSIGAIAYLAFMLGGDQILIISAAVAGGIFGFLRFNSHPARVFMGDGGSQFIGYALAVMVIILTQDVNPVLSPALPVLLLGLPIIDILAVFFLRAKHKLNLFKATSNHIHHRLLKLGFYHYESVIIIYSIQILFIISAVMWPYESDVLIMGLYLGVCLLVFSTITLAERSNWNAHEAEANVSIFISSILKRHKNLATIPYRILESGISLFIIAAAIMSTNIPIDLGVSSLILLLLLLVVVAIRWFGDNLYRLIMFVTIGFSVYLLSTYPPVWLLEEVGLIYIFFLTMTVVSFITARIAVTDQFQITPLDYLVIIIVIIVGMAPGIEHGASSIIWMVVQIIVLFYACELVIQNVKSKFNSFTGAAVLALGLIAFRGLI